MHGGDNLGLIVLLIIIGLFVLWVFDGGPKNQNVDQPFIKIDTANQTPAP